MRAPRPGISVRRSRHFHNEKSFVDQPAAHPYRPAVVGAGGSGARPGTRIERKRGEESLDMLFAIHALDCARGPELRKIHQEPHMAHIGKAGDYGVRIVMSGPLIEDDGATAKGSLLVVEADGRGNVERFNGEDPFSQNGVWENVSITAFLKKNG
jgi:uncharacterized protein YciI